jgi:hypothetical protein
VPRVSVAPFLDAEEARRFGFDWPSIYYTFLPGGKLRKERGARVQVTRVSAIDRGKKGVFRVLAVKTEREELNIYITPTGKLRVFKAGHGELVKKS